MSVTDALFLFIAAVGGGVLNSVAGGGSFLTFPTLLFTGVPAIQANATSAVALWPGSVASTIAYRREVLGLGKRIVPLSLVSILGGFLGARLLLSTSQESFRALIPWLLLAATVVFAFGSPLVARMRREKGGAAGSRGRLHRILVLGVQLVIAIYGGFFGGGIGILMLAALTLFGMEDVQVMNGLKNWLATCINGTAVVTFVLAGTVYWPQALVMLVGAVAGGYLGASTARRLDPQIIRTFVLIVGTVLTIYFFVEG